MPNRIGLVAALLLAVALVEMARRAGLLAIESGATRWLAEPIVGLTLVLLWHASPALAAVNVLAVLGLGLLAIPVSERPWYMVGAWDVLQRVRRSAVALATGPFVLAWLAPWRRIPLTRSTPAVRAGVGALVAMPALAIFGGLFSSADPAFGRALAGVVSPERLTEWMQQTVRLGAFTFAAAALLFVYARRAPASAVPAAGRVGVPETLGGLGAVALLFGAYLAFQARALFGGLDHVLHTAGLSLAEYARSGFFELLWCAILALPLLILTEWAVDQSEPSARRAFRYLAYTLLAMVALVLGSAAYRMALYVDVFGLTEQRLFSSVFMGWLLVVLGWCGWTVLRGQRERFVQGAVAAAIVAVLALNAIDPDAFIARVALTRAERGQPFDVKHAVQLSADAVPVLIARGDRLPPAERCELARGLDQRWSTSYGWRADRQTTFAAWRAVHAADVLPARVAAACAGQSAGTVQ